MASVRDPGFLRDISPENRSLSQITKIPAPLSKASQSYEIFLCSQSSRQYLIEEFLTTSPNREIAFSDGISVNEMRQFRTIPHRPIIGQTEVWVPRQQSRFRDIHLDKDMPF